MNLATKYLGLELRNPLIVGSSPISATLEGAKRLEKAGAAAIVLHSLFSEQFDPRKTDGASNYDFLTTPDYYVRHIRVLKNELGIPLVASLNALTEGSWIRYAQYVQDAGADALELNLYFLPRSDNDSSNIIEERAYQIVRLVKQFVTIPVAIKLSPWITSLPQFARRLEEAGAGGMVLFNRFIQPDIDTRTLQAVQRMKLSDSSELLIRLHWIAALAGRTRMSLCATGGIATPDDLVKALLAGSDAVQVVGALLRNGPEYLETMREGLEHWMEEHAVSDLATLREKGSALRTDAVAVTGRDHYIRMVLNKDIDKS